MKLDEGDGIVDVQICTEKDDVLLTTARGPVHPLRGRRGARVRRPHLDGRARHRAGRGRQGDLACRSCATSTATPDERAAYLKRASAVRRGDGEEEEVAAPEADDEAETAASAIELGEKRYVELSAAEQFMLTVSERGFGKRSSSYEYRITGRGGKGIVAMER